MTNVEKQKIVIVTGKSAGVAFLLTFLFGPLGMLYSTIMGGIFMFVVSVVIGFVTMGVGFFITWPICIIWGIAAVNSHNRRLAQT